MGFHLSPDVRKATYYSGDTVVRVNGNHTLLHDGGRRER